MALTHQIIGLVQFAGTLGRLAHPFRRGATAGQLVRMVATEQPPVSLFDLRRCRIGLNAEQTQRLGLHGRVNGSHLTSMHSMDNYYVSKLLPLIAESGMTAIPNPLINITLQGRHDTYPKRRGMTRVPELLAAGVPVAFGHDCVMDPWYSLGSADMLEVAHMGLHVAQMTSQTGMRQCFEAVTTNAAKVMGLQDYGIAAGCDASFVLLQARDPIEAIRLRATRLKVWRKGQLLSETAPAIPRLSLPGRTGAVS